VCRVEEGLSGRSELTRPSVDLPRVRFRIELEPAALHIGDRHNGATLQLIGAIETVCPEGRKDAVP
jgi:hypothetical protein